MEKLADGLQRLDEDSLLQVVQMVHDHKTSDTYTKNDVESKLSAPNSHFELWLTHLCISRWRVPCRSLHPSRSPRKDALGLYSVQDRVVGRRSKSVTEARPLQEGSSHG